MKDALKSVFALLLGTAFMMLGNGMLGTLISVRTLQNGASETETGLLMSGYFLGLIIATLRGSVIISQVGHIRAFAVFASTFSAAVLAHGLIDSFWFWVVLRCIEGICMGGFFMCTESWLNSKSDNLVRGKILSAYMFVVYISQGGSQFLLNVADPQAFSMLVFVSILMSIALVPVAMTKVREPEKPSPQFFPLTKLLSISPLGVFACFISGLMLGGVYGLGPVYADKLGLGVSGTATIMAVLIFGGLILQWPLGGISDRIDRRYVIAFTMAMAAVFAIVLLYSTESYWFLIVILTLFGGFAFAIYPLAICHANDFINEGDSDSVGVSGGLLLTYSSAAVISPFIGGILMQNIGVNGFPIYFAVIAVFGCAFTLYRIVQGRVVDDDDKGTYQIVPRTSTIATEMATSEEE